MQVDFKFEVGAFVCLTASTRKFIVIARCFSEGLSVSRKHYEIRACDHSLELFSAVEGDLHPWQASE